MREMRATPTREAYEAVFALCCRLMQRIVALPKPVIARVHGAASAAGCQLVATCDLAVAGESARFATPGVNIGLFCSTPMVALRRAVGRKAAMEMLLTGDLIDAHRGARDRPGQPRGPRRRTGRRDDALARQIAGEKPADAGHRQGGFLPPGGTRPRRRLRADAPR